MGFHQRDGHKRHNYWILRANYFPVIWELVQSVSQEASSEPSTKRKLQNSSLEIGSSNLVQRAIRAIVEPKSDRNIGSGFFVSSTGIVATSLHVLRDQEILTAVVSRHEKLPATIV